MSDHYSSALASLVEEISHGKSIILDLGSTETGSTKVFLDLRCNCYVEDLNELLQEISSDNPSRFDLLEAHLLDKPDGLKFDYVLCWDLLNYIDKDLQTHLFNLLAPHFKEGTLLHTMRYTSEKMPSSPGQFQIRKDLNFSMEKNISDKMIKTPILSTIQLLKNMGDFTLRSTIMNQQGMRGDIIEYLFDYGEVAALRNLKKNNMAEKSKYSSQKLVFSNVIMNGLKESLNQLKVIENSSVLEIGKKGGRSLKILNTLTEHLYVEDIYSSLIWQKKINNNAPSFSQNALNFKADEFFNLILLWDIVSILHPAQFGAFLLAIRTHLRVGAKLHLLLPINSKAPEKPPEYEINPDFSVSVRGEIQGNQTRTITTMTQLTKLLPGFKMSSFQFEKFSDKDKFLECVFELIE
ncbi:MAG: hypothetical protein COB38_07845 [Gammaproteobacteria bacterium]|nr:MAG: hypothetical protein COB38_07845 [Gammaproteobacteria bacterium]